MTIGRGWVETRDAPTLRGASSDPGIGCGSAIAVLRCRRPGLQGVRLEFALLIARLVVGLEKGHRAAPLPLVRRLATGHEDVLRAVVVERLASESTVESFEAQARDVEEFQPFFLVADQSEPVPPSSKVMSTRLSLTL